MTRHTGFASWTNDTKIDREATEQIMSGDG